MNLIHPNLSEHPAGITLMGMQTLSELGSFVKPPTAVHLLLVACQELLTGEKAAAGIEWKAVVKNTIKKRKHPSLFRETLLTFDILSVSRQQAERLSEALNHDMLKNLQLLHNQCYAAYWIGVWMHGIKATLEVYLPSLASIRADYRNIEFLPKQTPEILNFCHLSERDPSAIAEMLKARAVRKSFTPEVEHHTFEQLLKRKHYGHSLVWKKILLWVESLSDGRVAAASTDKVCELLRAVSLETCIDACAKNDIALDGNSLLALGENDFANVGVLSDDQVSFFKVVLEAVRIKNTDVSDDGAYPRVSSKSTPKKSRAKAKAKTATTRPGEKTAKQRRLDKKAVLEHKKTKEEALRLRRLQVST
jgi:hypothetical protein